MPMILKIVDFILQKTIMMLQKNGNLLFTYDWNIKDNIKIA